MNQQNSWISKAIFYHIYPLGLCEAPTCGEGWGQPVERLNKIHGWIPTIKDLGCNALYLGPLFESSTHGYDTADYYHVDKRLGTNQTLKVLSQELHQNGMKLVLDGVFNHVGRDFWAFRDLLANGESSRFKDWFSGVDFNKHSPFGDNFSYDCWSGYYSLVKLNLRNEEVKNHIFGAVEMWINDFGIDGLRLDVAEVMDKNFLAELADFCRKKKPDFWLMGEMIHGDYNQLANDQMLDSTTNYEAYKGLYSSHNDANYYEIAYTFNRQFGEHGVYKHLQLYNFADNHDVSRVASVLRNEAHLFPLHALLYGMPGIPSVYYGSERAVRGKKGKDDAVLRPSLEVLLSHLHPPIYHYIQKLAAIRQTSLALQVGKYKELHLSHQQFVFLRFTDSSFAVVAVNAAETSVALKISLDLPDGMILKDGLDSSKAITVNQRSINIEIPAFGASIFTN
ncbi:maltodextrin glucosidase [Emticicia aquatilis]|uniref:Maltodextrin glucosidase n=1 Tax=Emticicia aquatilis TaxID=1537369 RepID=A0A916YGS1_9BACT|nr:alpha-amylase family glycosyl hydrolase [Emticicia aquatilis]GGD44076.1 maltodextrin glucosidase [Emticicia aquatilis]